ASFRRALPSESWRDFRGWASPSARVPPLGQGTPRFVTIVEGDHTVAQDLIGLESLTGDHDDVAGTSAENRLLDGARAIEDDLVVCCPTAEPCAKRVADVGGVVAAGIIIGHDRARGELACDRAHLRPFAGITVTAAAEDTQKLAVRQFPRREQHTLEGPRRVRIVHQHRDLVTWLITALEAP